MFFLPLFIGKKFIPPGNYKKFPTSIPIIKFFRRGKKKLFGSVLQWVRFEINIKIVSQNQTIINLAY